MTDQPTDPTQTPPTNPPTETQEPETMPLPPPPALPFTFHATLSEYRKVLGLGRIVLALAISLIFWFRFGPVVWIVSVVSIALVIWLILFLLARRSITITSDGLDYRNAFGKVKTIRYDEISTVKVFANYLDLSFGTMPRVIIGKKNGGYFASIVGIFWMADDINKLLSVFQEKKLVAEFYTDIVGSLVIAKEFPDYVPYYERHPYWLAFFIVIAIVIAVVAFVLLTM